MSTKTIWPLIGSNLTYGCEVYGFGDLSGIEKIHTDFLNEFLM